MHLFCGQIKQLAGLELSDIRNLMIQGLSKNNLTLEDFVEQEVKTWGKSIKQLVKNSLEANLGEISIVLEYFVPGNLLRLDAVLIGYNHKSHLHIMVVEMKEWSRIIDSPDAHHVNIGVSQQPIRQHPAAQLNHYITSLKCYHSELQNQSSVQLSAMSYLPNFEDINRLFQPPHEIYRTKYMESCFGKEDEQSLSSFLKKSFINRPVDIKDLESFTNGVYSMSEASLAGISKALQGERFVSLLDEQRDVKMEAMKQINSAFQNHKQLVMIVQGDAGTGKTILGLDIIRQYIRKYPHSYFGVIPQTLRAVINGFNKDYALESGLQEPASLPTVKAILTKEDCGQIVVIDEAHRLTDVQSTIQNLRRRFQIIILLQDDKQRIKITEQGTVANICRALGYKPLVLKLKTQQRAKQGGTFMKNLDDLLEGINPSKVDLKQYELKVFESLHEIDFTLKEKNAQGYRVKWLAPFCWDWRKKDDDIRILDGKTEFIKAWNPMLVNQYDWYKQSNVNHIEQVGCIYTAQGLEFDYVGLIFWDDLFYDAKNGQWKVSLKDNYDRTFINEVVQAYGGVFNKYNRTINYQGQAYNLDGFIKLANATNAVEELIKNIYRILLSRGKKGLYIWFKDDQTKQYFSQHFGLIKGRK